MNQTALRTKGIGYFFGTLRLRNRVGAWRVAQVVVASLGDAPISHRARHE